MPRSALLLFLTMLSPLTAADAPVPVVQEPYHKTVFENDYVRIIDVTLPVGVTTRYHIHEIASVVVYFTKSTNASQSWDETTTTPRQTTPGDSRYAPYDVKPLTHRVTNTGTNVFHVFDIELLRQPSGTPFHPAPAALQPKWEEKLVRSSNVAIAPAARAELPATECGYLVICIAGQARVETAGASGRTLGPAAYAFHPPRSAVTLRNAGGDRAELVVLELK